MRLLLGLVLSMVTFTSAITAEAGGAPAPDYAGMLLQNQTLLSSPPKGCGSKTASLTTFELQQCSAVAFRDADKALNQAYAAAIKGSDAGRNETLKQAQRHWLGFRNAECDWQSKQFEGGSLAPVSMGNCLVQITRDRVRQLEEGMQP